MYALAAGCGDAPLLGPLLADAGSDAACQAGQTRCDGTCVDTDTDRSHCGACGNACASGMLCIAGECVDCGGDGGECCEGGVCGPGLFCDAGVVCRPCGVEGAACCPGDACGDGLACAGGTCIPCGGEDETCCDGVAPERLEVHGFGETRPIIDAQTEQARATNRRVEFRIVDPPPAER